MRDGQKTGHNSQGILLTKNDEWSIGRGIKEARESTGLDQAAFAEALGIASRETISRWERGLNFPPSDILVKIQRKYGISIDWLITGKGLRHLEGEGLKEESTIYYKTPFWEPQTPIDNIVDFETLEFLRNETAKRANSWTRLDPAHATDIFWLFYWLLHKATVDEAALMRAILQSWLELYGEK
jgi:transcriptional regulator with XRE-family HTH domain